MASNKRAEMLARAVEDQQGRGKVPEGFEERSFGIPLAAPGDELIGTYVGPGKSRKVGKGKAARVVPFYKVKLDSGAEVEVLGSSQLEMFFQSVKPGDGVWIRHTGQIKAGAHGRVNTYRTAVRAKSR